MLCLLHCFIYKKGERCHTHNNYFNLLTKVNREFAFILIFLHPNGADIKSRTNLTTISSIVKKIEYLSLFFISASLIKVQNFFFDVWQKNIR